MVEKIVLSFGEKLRQLIKEDNEFQYASCFTGALEVYKSIILQISMRLENDYQRIAGYIFDEVYDGLKKASRVEVDFELISQTEDILVSIKIYQDFSDSPFYSVTVTVDQQGQIVNRE